MKKILSTLAAVSFFVAVNAQEADGSKFNILGFGGIGFTKIQNDNEPNYNLNSNTGEILLNYNFNQRIGLATGIGFTELSGTAFNTVGNFYHERTLIKIPLVATFNSDLSDKFKFFTSVGFYGHSIVEDDYRFLEGSQKDFYSGWNFGFQFGLGLMVEVYDGFSFGINFNGQSDFDRFTTTSDAPFQDKQKIDNLNNFGLIFMFDL
jgi:opacity protein-like surface antigen